MPDSYSRKLEDKLLKVNWGLINFSLRLKIRDLEWVDVSREEVGDKELLIDEEQKCRHEDARFKKLIADAKDWQTSQLLHSYLERVKKIVSDVHDSSTGNNSSEIQEWFNWTSNKANELDLVLKSPRV